jgi:hypothetical protein
MEVGMSPYDVAKLDVDQQNAVILENMDMKGKLIEYACECFAYSLVKRSSALVYDNEIDKLEAKLDFYNKYKGTENEKIALQIISSNK